MASFTLAIAQSQSERGDIAGNVAHHLSFVELAAEQGAQFVQFPELSLTGYELDIAAEMALTGDEPVLAPLREQATRLGIAVLVGVPLTVVGGKPQLATLAFMPDGTLLHYAKQYLHGDECLHFQPGAADLLLNLGDQRLALAICADTNRPEHAARAAEAGATLYSAGVLFSERGYAADSTQLQRYAADHRMLVAMANHGGPTGGWSSAGRSAIWNPRGELLVAAENTGPMLLLASLDDIEWRGRAIGL
ncbi:carbon-nitrogen hydrolase family protein [Marinobacterium arenosum]|uniref:carbon-nitrogen hydrolase family protein n=1 Tax=Marinobacterium arenosum TaxID=2862496 RepID=UPI001C96E8A0|nr:carbon-nitrogen hydrolase family protein [Marinobacterium arenosum]MBY4677471.1 carbon-nitrogen hydrolase family protein [Marinobacterium arenosum]